MNPKQKRLSEEDKKHIIKHFEEKTANSIGKELGFKGDAVLRFLRRTGRYHHYKQLQADKKIKYAPRKAKNVKRTLTRHDKMRLFAEEKGFENAAEAIQEYGSREFIKEFENWNRCTHSATT